MSKCPQAWPPTPGCELHKSAATLPTPGVGTRLPPRLHCCPLVSSALCNAQCAVVAASPSPVSPESHNIVPLHPLQLLVWGTADDNLK